MKKLAFLGSALGLGLAALLVVHTSQAADHLDAPAVKLAANKMADINDVYSWMTSDGAKVNLVMTVSPADDDTHQFGPAVQYVFHVTSIPGFGMAGTETRVICTFASPTSAQCWVATGSTTKDYVTGDPTSTAGITSKGGRLKLYAGRRSDPFFFNLGGFLRAQGAVEAAGAIMKDPAGCPKVDGLTAARLRGALSGPGPAIGPCPTATNANLDCFATYNVKAIVVQVDKTLLNSGSNTILSVWGSSHATP